MFEELLGIPAHPLFVHAPVVLVPLLALVAAAYAVARVVRPHTRLVLGGLAIVTPVSALLAKLSGDAFYERLDRTGQLTEGFRPVIENHQDLGNATLLTATVLGVLTLLLVYFIPPSAPSIIEPGADRRRQVLLVGLRVLTLVAAAVSLYFVIRAGHTGSEAVWQGR